MLNIKIICVGKIKDTSLSNLNNEYTKRLSKYAKFEVVEINDEKVPLNYGEKEALAIKEIECNKIIEKIQKINKCYVFCLDAKGKQFTSEEFSNEISKIATYDASTIVFVIGGTLGLSKKVLDMSNSTISFSKMTFTHQLIRLFLLEQVFRAFKILNNETYHH